jgi:hypothetical protein
MVLSFHYQQIKIDPKVYTNKVNTLLEDYIRRTLKWSYMSMVEKDPLKKISYANYSVATMIGLKEYMKIFNIPTDVIKRWLGEDLSSLEYKIIHVQKISQKK